MYIKIRPWGTCGNWDYGLYAANHHKVMESYIVSYDKSAVIRAAKKMAMKLNIEYREN